MFTRFVHRFLRYSDGQETSDDAFVIRRVDSITSSRLPTGFRLLVFGRRRLLNEFETPPRKARRTDDEWWLIPVDDTRITLTVAIPFSEPAEPEQAHPVVQEFRVDITLRFEAGDELHSLLQGRQLLTAADLENHVHSKLVSVIGKPSAFPQEALCFGTDAHEQLRAKLSVALQWCGLRCTCLSAFEKVSAALSQGNLQLATDADAVQTTDLNEVEISEPQLIIDWGSEPRAGWHTTPEFHLTYPYDICDTPVVVIETDESLDAPAVCRPRLQAEGDRYWMFHVSLPLTSQGAACSPGQYLITIHVAFPPLAPCRPRFFRAVVRLRVQPQGPNASKVIVDGDGFSEVRLGGFPLRDCVREYQSVARYRNTRTGAAGMSQPSSPRGDIDVDRTRLRQEYRLRIDQPKEEGRAKRIVSASNALPTESLSAIAANSQNNSVIQFRIIAGDTITFGRDRANHIVTRFLPRSHENDERSTGLSRRHALACLGEAGLQITDLTSNSGTSVNGRSLSDSRSFRDENLLLRLGSNLPPKNQFEIQISTLFSTDPVESWMPDVLSVLQISEPELWRRAASSGITAAFIWPQPENPHSERTLVVWQQVTLSVSETGDLRIGGPAHKHAARILNVNGGLWLQCMNSSRPIYLGTEALQVGDLIALTNDVELVLQDHCLLIIPKE